MKNFEKEMEIYQSFVYSKISNFQLRINQTVESSMKAGQNIYQEDNRLGKNPQSQIIKHQYQAMPIDKEKIDAFDKELANIQDQIKFKREYFEKIQEKILNKIDLSSF